LIRARLRWLTRLGQSGTNAIVFDQFLSICIRLASAAVILGWGLSAVGQLNLRGYLLAGIPAVVAVAFFSRRRERGSFRHFNLRAWLESPLKRRVRARGLQVVRGWKSRRLLPMIFWLTFGLIVLGSVLHAPNNFDGLSYRMPKVLYWLDRQGWHWIDAPLEVINYTLPNYEWLTVPCFLVTGGFHSTVVINWIAFLLLPPLFFSLLRTLGASGRAAYDWMWLFPSGYLIAMQAGGIGNDLLGLTAILAGLHCANRFVATGNRAYLWDALLAAGFCTGIKVSNLPLAGFVLIILLKDRNLLRTNRLTLALAGTSAALVSALIPLLLNLAHTGTILGTTNNYDLIKNPAAGWLGNTLITLTATFAPPIFPGANQITTLLEHGLGGGLLSWLQSNYGKFTLRLNELPQEECGALGLGITLALIMNVALWLRLRAQRAGNLPVCKSELLPWQRLAWWGWLGFAGLVVFAKLGTGMAFPRNLLPWSPFLLAPILAVIGREAIIRSLIWRRLLPLISLSVLPGIILTPSRPLIPQPMLLKLAQKSGLSNASLERLDVAYDVYAQRADPFTTIKRAWPEETRIIGLLSDGAEPTAAWWTPYGTHRCVYVLSEAGLSAARSEGVQYIVIAELSCQKFFNMDTARWLETHHARQIKAMDVRVVAGWPSIRYTLARFETAGGGSTVARAKEVGQ
jgi:hypothetical protein